MTPDDAKPNRDDAAGRKGHERSDTPPAAGPHAKPDLTNEDATPGAGSLPERTDGEADPAGG